MNGDYVLFSQTFPQHILQLDMRAILTVLGSALWLKEKTLEGKTAERKATGFPLRPQFEHDVLILSRPELLW
jgi:hypothetical protein